ncbi:YcxB family protein [Marininema halotolerans]|uniref:YcxB-like protein n=1 Tax=Marininema halotolerans TaxID=1155944 RepID=A0A1I6TUT5_9BACL|nr:YcxB family protein [Marininema halotolerans]SFS92868.1 YcxB-like protein [Marininema halotolerans]
MTISYQLTKKDYLNFYRHYIFSENPGVLLLPVVVFFLIFKSSDFDSNLSSLIFVGIFGGLLVYLFWIRVGKQFENVKKAFVHLDMNFSESCWFIKSEYGESTINWSSFNKMFETKQYFYFRFHSGLSYIIPKRAFLSERQQNEFRLLAIQCMEKNKVA